MLKRILSSALMITLTAFAIWNKWLFIVVIVLLTMGGLYEFFSMIRKKGIPIYSYLGIFIGVAIPISIFTQFELTKNCELLFIVIGFLLLLLMQFLREDNHNAVVGISTTLFGVLYVSWFLSFLVKIRLLLPGMSGIGLLTFIIAVTKSGDVGALLLGSKFGKHELLAKSLEVSLAFYARFVCLRACIIPCFRCFSSARFLAPWVNLEIFQSR
ncbi:MAG: phosphatidate cytidylyltransferase [Candidatus Omnitrophica bacterium]|nr:phosphatidate cytidylyltransferase [Candidatus Omnitrophota bacterium]